MIPFQDRLLARYTFEDPAAVGRDGSGRGHNAQAAGTVPPSVSQLAGRSAVTLPGGRSGTSYLELPSGLLRDVSDHTGITVAAWVRLDTGTGVWERIFDFGRGESGPYLFLTRNLRGTLSAGGDLIVDPGRGFARGEWMHIAISVAGTQGGTLSSAGPVVYVNGEPAADGSISQTSSGHYAQLRRWFDTFGDPDNYARNYIGRSQYAADDDFAGSFSDFRVYAAGLSADDVIEIMCDSLTDEEIVRLAANKYLSFPAHILTSDIALPSSLMGGKVSVSWTSSNPAAVSHEGGVWPQRAAYSSVSKDEASAGSFHADSRTDSSDPSAARSPQSAVLTAALKAGTAETEKNFAVTVLPPELPPYTVTVHGGGRSGDEDGGAEVSEVMYGLFYEDINNAADGGIYAEMVQNRSFESFVFDTYSHESGACGCSTGRNREPLLHWFGDLDKMTPQSSGTLGRFLGSSDPDVNGYYVTVADGATIYNRGFNDTNGGCAMNIRPGAQYDFTVWAKAEQTGYITLQLQDPDGEAASDVVTLEVESGGVWKKYGVPYPADGSVLSSLVLTGSRDVLGQLALTFEGEISIELVSLVPRDVWGAGEEDGSPSARANYLGNPNYRLRRDLVEALAGLHPKFLRFPGGCISEGSFIWDNVYDWKDSVDTIELRKENFNVWGYMMTMGLGYMEYFQLAEDLNAVPLPVMACGVLCQARSDYAHPAGGELRDFYIKNFTDLIDFAVGMDFEHNEWAAMRRKMGHEAPFDLRYLGVGNENWGTEFFANFEVFKARIDAYMREHYPKRELHIISTVGAQADDDAYQQGWKFLSGNLEGSADVEFADGNKIVSEHVTWYADQPDYMDTIADEHYYRSNDYLLQNADRYNYYYRARNEDGSLNRRETSKVFVGEYASTDKNTLAGAVAEAAAMTGFERNADVVRLAAYAPLFNKVLTDGTYRWTPDCIWFDDESVWYTPNYYVQRMYAKYIGKRVLPTSFSTYRGGRPMELAPRGGIEIAAGRAEVTVRGVKVISNADGAVLLDCDFTAPEAASDLDSRWQAIPGSAGYTLQAGRGLVLRAQSGGLNGLYLLNDDWNDYRVEAVASKASGEDGFYIGVGLTDISPASKDVLEYAVGYGGSATGVKVHKHGTEGYTLGDYSSSTAAGNLRAANYEPLEDGREYLVTVDYGGADGRSLVCSYTDAASGRSSKVLNYKLEAYNRDVFHSVTADDERVYVKLVNADGVDKRTRLNFDGLNAAGEAKLITLTGDAALLNVPNVNKKNAEIIVPAESRFKLERSEAGRAAILNLPANSVSVAVLDLEL
ncbi:alpha-L-arabinofuranosidase C-terminal domain-containing protein [Saccharibacillus sp. CPCC 101409]|uniref:alpha-L-arabinofuranosidase C-terminal domain-containing protein n=1 Tax=Saccharibacillus sp. CPCC 101409 TaxID=3058041 RepID=UPI0026725E79|nr:alpha-L-arabinofuranosidase C-terminal domain-containing protein [Saccharibacillus sp. CPCC 101409]MDO3411525.1 alpha-L-arabinofuranosidase C-terminal domain-containing protein [Saccharibacillus sp. CPCC 101409]